MTRRKTNRTAADLLILRSRGISDAGTLSRHNLRILKGIVLQDNRHFVKVWTKTSKSTICCESGRIYFENYQRCYSCLPSEPKLLYELPKRSKAEKIEDALLCQSPLDKALPTSSDHKPCLLALTANNWLYRLSAETGEELQKVYLSSHHKFRYISWDVDQETFYVKTMLSKGTLSARQAGLNQNTLMYLTVFNVFPLQLVGSLEINKSIFGNTAIDVSLSQGVLAVSHSNKVVKLYSFEHIMNKFMTNRWELGEQCYLESSKTVGEAPYGIPVNIDITDCPPVLFEVMCFNNGIQIGGHPWHFIYTPRPGTHHICSLKNNTLVHNGIQDMKCCSLESDWIYFHPDDSGRIIHVGPSTINMLKILGEMESDRSSGVFQDFSITAHRDQKAAPQVTVTSSGRTVKRRFHQLDDDPEQETFRMVEYEDELDLLSVVEVTNSGDEGKAHVRLHDNQTGVLLKTVPLMESWDETYRHELFFDKDTIVHIEQTKTNVCCNVYKIRPESDEFE